MKQGVPLYLPHRKKKTHYPATTSYAQAIAKHGGSRMSTVSNVFARVDVAIPAYWEEQATDDSPQGRQMMVVPMINEVGSSPVQ